MANYGYPPAQHRKAFKLNPAVIKRSLMNRITTLSKYLIRTGLIKEAKELIKLAGEYVVQPGDTLGQIAINYEVSVEEIQEANGMGTSTNIRGGQELIIPGIESRNTEVVAATLLGEVGTTEPSAMPAIMAVIKNRAEVLGIPDHEVVIKKNQFSYWNGKEENAVLEGALGRSHSSWDDAMSIARGDVDLPDIKGSTHYYSKSINPPFWAKDTANCWEEKYKDDYHVFGKDTSGRYGNCEPE